MLDTGQSFKMRQARRNHGREDAAEIIMTETWISQAPEEAMRRKLKNEGINLQIAE
jgi:hypothetical protein